MTRTFPVWLAALAGCQFHFQAHGFGTPTTTTTTTTAPSRSSASRSTTVTPPSGHRDVGAPETPAATGRMAGVTSREIDRTLIARELEFARSCFADYDDTKARWAPYEAKLRARFEAIRQQTNYYARRDALAALAANYFADLKEAKLDVAGADWELLTHSGLAFEIDAYAAAENRARGIPAPVSFFHAYYPPPSDDVLAGDFYCELATQGGAHRTHAFSGIHMTELLPPARASALDHYLQAAKAGAERTFALAPAPEEHLTSISLADHIAHAQEIPAGAWLEIGGVLVSERRGSDGVTLRLVQEGTSERQHDCVETGKVDRIDRDGHVRYRERCQWSFGKTEIAYVVTFPDVPANLRPGDWIDFDGTIRHVRKGAYDSETHVATAMTLDLTGTLVRRVARGRHRGDDPRTFAVIAQYGDVH